MHAANTAEPTWAVATHRLSKRYGRDVALDSVDLRVPEGAVYVMLGTNGSGKSTALKMLLNLETPDAGTAQVFGLDSTHQGPAVRAHVGYVPERHDAGYKWMTCERLLQHVAKYYPTWDAQYASHLVAELELRARAKVGGFSKGETRRLQLVLALAHRPPLLLLDEPTDGLDPIVRRRALELIAGHLADSPTTVLISTHQIYEVESLADHIGVLRQGRLVAQMTRQELQRTVRNYRVQFQDGWNAPAHLVLAGMQRSRSAREALCTFVGDEQIVTEQLILSGAQVQDVLPLALEDAAYALLAHSKRQ